MFEDARGVVWLSESFELRLLTPTGVVPVPDPILDEPVEFAAPRPEGGVLIVTAGGHAYRADGTGPAVPIPIQSEGPSPRFYQLVTDETGTSWLLADPGLFRFDPRADAFVPFALSGLPDDWPNGPLPVYAVASHDDLLWFGVAGGVVVTDLEGAVVRAVRSSEDGGRDGFDGSAFAFAGPDAYAFTTAGLHRLSAGADDFLPVPLDGLPGGEGLPPFPYFSSAVHAQGRVLAGSDPVGLLAFAPDFSSVEVIDGSAAYWGVQPLSDGTTWAARSDALVRIARRADTAARPIDGETIRGLLALDDGMLVWTDWGLEFLEGTERTRLLSATEPLDDTGRVAAAFAQLTPNGAGGVYLGTLYGFCELTDVRRPDELACHPGYPTDEVNIVRKVVVQRGKSWIATNDGFFVMDATGGFAPVRPVPGFEGLAVLDVAAAGDGLLVGTSGGLVRVDPMDEVIVDEVPALTGRPVPKIVPESNGAFLIGTIAGGVWRVDADGRGAERLIASAALPASYVTRLVPGADGTIYVGTTSGLVVAARDGTVRRTYAGDELPHPEVSGIAVDSSRLWVATLGGVSTFPLDATDTVSAKPYLREVVVDGRKVAGYPSAPRRIDLAVGDDVLEGIIGVTGTRDAPLSYRLKPHGEAAEWQMLGEDGAFAFAQLAPGRYALEARVSEADEPAWSVPVTVAAPWYETTGGVAGSTLACATLLVGVGAAGQRRRQLEREAEIQRRSVQEAHHRIKNGLHVVSSVLAMQGSRDPSLAPALGDVQERIEGVARVHERLSIEEEGGARLSELIEALTTAAARLHGMEGLIAVHSEADVLLASGDALPVGMIYNELLTNALRHGDVGEGRPVIVTLQEGRLTVANDVLDGSAGMTERLGSHVVDVLARQGGYGVARGVEGERYVATLLLSKAA